MVHANDCLYRRIYDAMDPTYLLFNTLETLSRTPVRTTEELLIQWTLAQQEMEQRCQQPLNKSLEVLNHDGDTFHIRLGNKEFSLIFQGSSEHSQLHLIKKADAYKDETLFSIARTHGQKDFVKLVGRDGPTERVTRYEFLFLKDSVAPDLQSERSYSQPTNLFSLQKIYGSVPAASSFKLSVGVIGTGLDYNHPGLANILGFRRDFEDRLQNLDALRLKLLTHTYASSEEYLRDIQTHNSLQQTSGFPLWMDQAKHTPFPFDQVIINGLISMGQEHETRITSRIVRRQDNAIQIFFARRMMGVESDDLNVMEVLKHFRKQGVKIVNMSFGSSCGLLPQEEAQWARAFKKYPDMIFVVAAGNSGILVDEQPACPSFYSRENKNVISVTAVNAADQLASYYGTSVNFGRHVDVAIAADDLPVFVPLQHVNLWNNNPNGATSVAAAEISRILAEAIVDGYVIDPKVVKTQLQSTSRHVPQLEGSVKTSGVVDEVAFRNILQQKRK